MNTFKKITITSAVAFALFTFNACGDDSGSSSGPGENGSSHMSSSTPIEDLDESSSSINGDTSSSVTPGSSSSVILSDSEESSSSVKGSAPADGASSSSVIPDPNRESSSSSVKSSSSSAKSSSSVSSSSSVKSSSSSSVKQSSSSSVLPKSSSSVFEVDSSRLCTPGYAFCNRALGADSMHAGAYKKFTYEGRSYYYLTINGKNQDGKAASVTVMAENLNVGEMVDGNKDQNDDSKIERYCYDNDTTNCEEYGGLYQWAEAMQLPSECNTKSCADQIKPNHQGICPKGWHLLTYDEFYIVVHADGNVNPLVEGVRAMSFGGHNYSGYSLLGGGMRITPSGNFKEINEVAYWFYPGEKEYENYSCGDDGYMGNTSKYLKTNVSYKQNGLSIRCVMNE